ncbi:GGDEF domain-containing protein [soil metagenome]
MIQMSKKTLRPEGSRRSGFERLADAFLGTHRSLRFALRQTIVVMCVYAACVGLSVASIRFDMMNPVLGFALIAYMVFGEILFYLLVRSGWSLRFDDVGLVLAQSTSSVLVIVFAYTICSAGARDKPLILLPLVLVHTMFFSTPRNAAAVCALAIGLLTAVVAIMTRLQPEQFDPVHEWFAVAMVAVTLPALTVVAAQVGAMRNKLVQQKSVLVEVLTRVEKLATRDELTGLLNRRHMLQVLDEHLSQYHRSGRGFSVAMVDLDHFKRINDTFGHAAGDEALRAFAKCIRSALREVDTVGRWGGEEFLVLMPDGASASSGAGLERLRTHLRNLRLPGVAPALRLSFSAGIAAYQHGESIDQLIARADLALYAAKAGGRQRTVNSQAGDLDSILP